MRFPSRYRFNQLRVSDLIRAGGSLDEAAYGGTAELTRNAIENGEARQTELKEIDLARVAWRPEAIALLRTVESDLRPAAGVSRFDYAEHAGDLELSLTFAEEHA